MISHIAGIPVEETILTFGPATVLMLSVGIVLTKERARRRIHKRRSSVSRASPPATAASAGARRA